MGNSLPLPCLCQCHHEDDAAAAAAKKRRRKQRTRPARRNVRGARPSHVVPVVDVPAEYGGEEEGEVFTEAWRPGCRVERPAGCGGEDGGLRRVKIVMRRKDIAELVARLEQRGAAERNATMVGAELNAGLGGDGRVIDSGRGCSVTMSPCRDAWRPRLSIIPENY